MIQKKGGEETSLLAESVRQSGHKNGRQVWLAGGQRVCTYRLF